MITSVTLMNDNFRWWPCCHLMLMMTSVTLCIDDLIDDLGHFVALNDEMLTSGHLMLMTSVIAKWWLRSYLIQWGFRSYLNNPPFLTEYYTLLPKLLFMQTKLSPNNKIWTFYYLLIFRQLIKQINYRSYNTKMYILGANNTVAWLTTMGWSDKS